MMFNAPFRVEASTVSDYVYVYDADDHIVWSVDLFKTTDEERDAWTEWAEYLVRVLNQRRDNDVAIGEHAFRSGYEAACSDVAHCESVVSWPDERARCLERAWSDYDPPEELKGL